MDETELAKKRAAVILQVRTGKLTATEGAAQLGVSRKTYYEWESRALAGMMKVLGNGEPGRPAEETDQEKEALKQRVASLEKDLLIAKQTIEVKEVLRLYEEQQRKDALKAGKKKDRIKGGGA